MAFPDDYNWKLDITTDATKIASVETDFPYYFDLSNITSADFWNNVQSDGGDLRVSSDSAGATQVPLEVVFIDTVAETGEIHFKDTTDSSSNKTYYLWWDDSTGSVSQPLASSTYGSENVWGSNYQAVYHFQDNANDSTSNANDGTVTGATNATGIIGNEYDYDGSADRIDLNQTSSNSTIALTVIASTNSSARQQILSADSSSRSFQTATESNLVEWIPFINGSATALTSSATLSTTRKLIQTKFTGTDAELYLEGNLEDSASVSGSLSTGGNIFVGQKDGGAQRDYLDGTADEVRISTTVSTGWTTTEYEVLRNNSTFWTTGTPTPNTETLVVDLLEITDTFNDIELFIERTLDLDALTITDTFNDVNFFINRTLDLDALTITNTFNDISISTGQTLMVDTLEITDTFNDVTFVNERILDLETETITNTFNDINFGINRNLDIDLLEITNTFNDVTIEIVTIKLEIDSGSITYNFNDVSFKVNFDQDVFNELEQAKADVEEMFNETGENVFYQVNTETYNQGGQLSNFSTIRYPIKVMWQEGTNYRNEINEIGEYSSGNKVVKLLPMYTFNSTKIHPRLNDFIVTEDGDTWEIIQIRDNRIFNGVIELYCDVVKRDNDRN